MSLVIPNTFVGGAGHKARASEVNANFAAVSAKFTEGSGGIDDSDIKALAGIKGSKISTTAGTRLTASNFEDKAVDSRVLYADTGVGAPLAAVGSADHIKDAIITNAKLVDATIKRGKLNLQSVVVAIPAILAHNDATVSTGLNSATAFPVVFHSENVTDFRVQLRLDLTTGTGAYRFVCSNDDSNNQVGFNVRLWYLPI